MARYRTIYLTERGLRHRQDASAAAPPELEVLILRQPDRDALLTLLADAVFLISERAGVVDAEMIAAAPRLRLILRIGSLAHDIDLDAARRAGVVVSTWPVRPVIMVAEHAMLQLLALAKRLRETQAAGLAAADWGTPRRTDEDTFSVNWTRRTGIDGLWQKTVGILGFGEIGAELARRLAGWDCSVCYHRRRRLPSDAEDGLGIAYLERDALLAASDFVVNLLPYSAATDQALGAAAFALMKPGACLASCGSGSVIDEAALAAALASGHLGGAALDTFEWEPVSPGNPLRLLAVQDPGCNLVLTPHIAAGTMPGGVAALRALEYTPIVQFLAGQPLRYRLA